MNGLAMRSLPKRTRREPVRHCHYCGSPLPEIRLGVRLPPLQARLFDLIMRSGLDGITRNDLIAVVWELDVNHFPKLADTLKQHVWQINDAIRDTGYRIRTFGSANRINHHGFFRLEKTGEREGREFGVKSPKVSKR